MLPAAQSSFSDAALPSRSFTADARLHQRQFRPCSTRHVTLGVNRQSMPQSKPCSKGLLASHHTEGTYFKLRPQRPQLVTLSAAAVSAAAPVSEVGADARHAKEVLRRRIMGTDRGASASTWQRALVAEAQADVERLGSKSVEEGLEGLWRLVWTTADDVKPLIAAARLPFAPVQVGDIFQRFSSPQAGRVQNIIRLRAPGLSDQTFTVDAAYSVRSPLRIALVFEAASLSEVRISAGLEAVLAPAMLPRTWLTQRLLQELRELNVRLPLTTPSQLGNSSSSSEGRSGRMRQRGFGEYVLSYIDDDMLIGTASQGTFIFERAFE